MKDERSELDVVPLTRAPSTVGVEDMLRNIAGLDDSGFYISSHVILEQAVREWRDEARKLLALPPTIASEAGDGKAVQAHSVASERVCDHPTTEKAIIGEFSELLERWREQRDYLRGLKERGDLTRDWGECSLNHACRIVEDLTAAITASQVIANQENLHGRSPETDLPDGAVAWRWRWKGKLTHNPWRYVNDAKAISHVTADIEPLYASPHPESGDVEKLRNQLVKANDPLSKCEYCGSGPCENCLGSGYADPPRAELALAAEELAKLPKHVYWLLAKGRTRPDEPLWAIQITNLDGEKIAEVEGDHPADVVRHVSAILSETDEPGEK